MRRRVEWTLAALIVAMGLAAPAGAAAGEARSIGLPDVTPGPVADRPHRGSFRLFRPGPAVASMPDRAHPRGPTWRGHRPFGSVQNGLETGIGYGYPTLYPVGGGNPMWFVHPRRRGHGG